MEKTDIVICLKKKNRLKKYQKNYRETKSLNIIINIYVVLDRLTEIKS